MTNNNDMLGILKESGHRVRIIHNYREHPRANLSDLERVIDPSDPDTFIHRPNGYTAVSITAPGGFVAHGLSVCSANDGFDRKKGVKIALGRAINRLHPSTRSSHVASHVGA